MPHQNNNQIGNNEKEFDMSFAIKKFTTLPIAVKTPKKQWNGIKKC
jgi:hypothetical protein